MIEGVGPILSLGLGLLTLIGGGFLGYIAVDRLLKREVYDTQNAVHLLKAARVEDWNAFRTLNSDWRPQLNGEDFSNASLPAVNLARADLVKAKFHGATLDNADFSESTLREANFMNASLRHVAFDKADLENAVFEGALSTEASFRGANVKGAKLQRVQTSNFTLIHDEDELLKQVRQDPSLLRHLDPRHFEQLVAAVLTKLGYQAQVTSGAHDRGFDIRATRSDPIEGERPYMIECKSYGSDRQVGIAPIRAAYAAKMIEKADELIVVTNTGFTGGAKTLASEQPDIELVDYHRLLDWINKTA